MSDKAPIEPGDTYSSGGLSIGKFSFRMREMVIAIGLIVVVVMCFVFIGLFSASPKPSGAGGNAAAQKGSNPTFYPTGTAPPPPTLNPRYCTSVGCIKGASYVRGLMNITVDPCEDLYTYACGNWNSKHPVLADRYLSSPSVNLYKGSMAKLKQLLTSDVIRDTPWAAERKAKDLYTSCMDDYGRMVQGGNPFIDKVLKHIGGFWLVKELPSDWDILSAVEKIHVDFWTNVLFSSYVGSDYTYGYTNRRPIITISSGGLGMGYYNYYLSNVNNYNQTRTAYKKYMRNIASLLARDGKVVPGAALNSSKLDIFVDDVMSIETQLANITKLSRYADYSSRSGRVSLQSLNRQANNLFDWISFFKYLFNDNYISQYTYVRQSRPQYLPKVFAMIQALPSGTRNRILNNYFVWQMARKYAPVLSFEYIHAEQEYYTDRYNYGVEPQDPSDDCFNVIRYNMDKALSHLFIKDHFSDDSKKKVTEITLGVKQSLINRVDKMTFMDQPTKDYAKKKLKASTETIGYPNWIMDGDQVDLIYYQLNVSKTNFFHNMLSLNVFQKKHQNDQLKQAQVDNHDNYRGATFDHYIAFYTFNELEIPAGVLQEPTYSNDKPHYLNFGSLGTMIGDNYITGIDEYGATYDMDGERMLEPDSLYIPRSWWSNSTQHNFNNAKQCFQDFYINKTAGTYVNDSGITITVPVSPTQAGYYESPAAREVGGIRTAYNAYQTWQNTHGNDKLAPGMDMSNEQMFFLAYAQTKCKVTRPFPYQFSYRWFPVPESMKLNGAVAMMDEYSKAFGCKAGATLNPEKKCSVF